MLLGTAKVPAAGTQSQSQRVNERKVMVEVGEYRQRLLSIKRGEVLFEAANQWRKDLQRQFEAAFEKTDLPDRPDYERVNDFLVRARRLAMDGGPEL